MSGQSGGGKTPPQISRRKDQAGRALEPKKRPHDPYLIASIVNYLMLSVAYHFSFINHRYPGHERKVIEEKRYLERY